VKKLIVFICIAHLFCLGSFAQTKGKKSTQELFAGLREDEKLVAECEQKLRAYQIANYGRVLPRISGHCWGGCATSLTKPRYPNEARRLRIFGAVKVETVVDETGKVIYARAVSGQPFLRQAAEEAAYYARYTPKRTCGDKPIKFRWTITYNFILN
jgi:TonB family protein